MAKAAKTILLFDNEPALDELYQNVFEEVGHNFIVTENINQAVKLCRQENINLVLSNMLLDNDNQTNEKLGFVKDFKNFAKNEKYSLYNFYQFSPDYK